MSNYRSRTPLVVVVVVSAGCTVDGTGISSAEPTGSKSVSAAPDGGESSRRASGDLATGVGLDAGPDSLAATADAMAGDAITDLALDGPIADLTPADVTTAPPPRDPPSFSPPLLLSLPLDDPDGSLTARDRSGLQQQVTLHRLNSERCWVDGRRGGALALAGNGYLKVAARGSLGTVSRFSFSAWARREQPDDDGVLISRGAAGAGGYDYRLRIAGDRLRVQLNDPGPRLGFHQESRIALPVRRWVHVAMTFDGRRVRLYLDGALSDEWPYGQPLAAVGPERALFIGASESPTDGEGVRDRLTSRLDDVAFYGAALEPAQVAALAARKE